MYTFKFKKSTNVHFQIQKEYKCTLSNLKREQIYTFKLERSTILNLKRVQMYTFKFLQFLTTLF